MATELELAYGTVTDAQKSRITIGDTIVDVAIESLTVALEDFPAPANDPVKLQLMRLLTTLQQFKSFELTSLKSVFGMNPAVVISSE